MVIFLCLKNAVNIGKIKFGNNTKLLFSNFYFCLFLTKLSWNQYFAFADEQLFDGEIKIFISCLIFVCRNKMHVAKSFHFRCVSS